MAAIVVLLTAVVSLLAPAATGELVVKVGHVDPDGTPVPYFRQRLAGNSSVETVVVEYEEPDGGTVVTQLTDFRTRAQLTRIIVPGEEELRQPTVQVLCFVSAHSGDLIAPEAVMKLRQKHSGVVRVAEEDRGAVVQDSPLRIFRLDGGSASSISSHLTDLCKDASAVFTSHHEVHAILGDSAGLSGAKFVELLTTPSHPNYESLPRCSILLFNESQQRDDSKTLPPPPQRQEQDGNGASGQQRRRRPQAAPKGPCQCSRQVWFHWYPCALKYCKNKESGGGGGEHRCGIRTCKKSMNFRYPVKSTAHCPWDEM